MTRTLLESNKISLRKRFTYGDIDVDNAAVAAIGACPLEDISRGVCKQGTAETLTDVIIQMNGFIEGAEFGSVEDGDKDLVLDDGSSGGNARDGWGDKVSREALG